MAFLAQQGSPNPRGEDSRWSQLVRSYRSRNRTGRDQRAQDVATLAAIYQDHQDDPWQAWQDAQGIARLERGRPASSKFHAVCRYLLELGVDADDTGAATVMAATLDAWEKTGIAPDQIPAWIARIKGGMREIAYPAPPIPATGKIGKHVIDLSALGPAAQEQIRAALADDYPEDYEPADVPVRNVRSRGGIIFPAPRNYNVYTGDAMAKRIVDFLPIGPDDFCIDPCRGRRSFYNALPEGRRDWAEITEGRNFLTYDFGRPVDWCIGNFPWSGDYAAMLRRAFAISKHVVQLVKLDVALNTTARIRDWQEAGHGLRSISNPINWKDAEFVCEDGTPKAPEGFPLVAIWWTRGWPCFFQPWFDRPAAIEEAAD